MNPSHAIDARIVKDGFGSEWLKCHFADCDLHVVRPGKAQCSNCDVMELRAERAQLREVLELIARQLGEDGAALVIPAESEALKKLRALKEWGLIGAGEPRPETDVPG